MLVLVLLVSLFNQGHAVDSGTHFVTAFPENLAYYFPAQLKNSLKITTLIFDTTVVVTMNGTIITNEMQATPGVMEVQISNMSEVSEFSVCNKTVIVKSNKIITVVSISKRGDSIQANMVPPTANLGMEYLIPSLNYTEYAELVNTYSTPQFPSANPVPLDFSYRLMLINAVETANQVKVTEKLPTGQTEITVELGPFEMTQTLSSSYWFKVSANANVAVILTNPCIDSLGCRCNMISHQIRPKECQASEYIYPPVPGPCKVFLTSDVSATLTSDGLTKVVEPGSHSLVDCSSTNTNFRTSVPSGIRVIRPGLFIDLIPKSRFASCFLVHKHTTTMEAYALVIVETDKKDEVHLDAGLVSPSWMPITGTLYSHGNVTLTANSHSIWHLSSKIAVYVFEKLGSQVFTGGPAVTMKDEPDPSGCVLVSLGFELGSTPMNWQASRAHCRDKSMLLASPNINFTQNKMVETLNKWNANGVAWLGLRRSLTTSDWYWHKNAPFDFANWDTDQPAKGLCVSMKMEQNGKYTWTTERCCTAFLPLCVRDMVVLTTIVDNSNHL